VLVLPHLGIVFVLWGGRYMLMLHAMCHRVTWKRDSDWLNLYAMNGLGILFGSTPNSFFAHHMGMHHPENNLERDLSSTLAYRRDRFGDFLHYWGRFAILGLYHVPHYFKIRGRHKLRWSLISGEVAWLAIVLALGLLNPAATAAVIVLPWALLRWFMMCGNFAQHAFVDVDDPGNCYRNSTCLTETPYNHKAYNDGYHIVHHIKPGLHWTEMATWFDEHAADFAANDAVVFRGIRNNQAVWWLLMTGRYDVLAEHLVDYRGRSQEEKIAFLQGRVQRTLGSLPSWARREAPLTAPILAK
jgi:fatty acid desaturase